ncbi:hypothetical protein L911_2854 [Vibrio fluvialis I21563]|jgi:hypothetical protein|uniref:Uncharacterized protein n=1 Tax=Vibrio fluvialis PG41 TaxID=1336752 RepID=S7IAE6_VIBFL|nr:hypothetical protein L911_2854 [Vibrio fluvialis I21563]EPP24882.1 hypothetical protein L910_0028 [Vibrio fluvialis PG41]
MRSAECQPTYDYTNDEKQHDRAFFNTHLSSQICGFDNEMSQLNWVN